MPRSSLRPCYTFRVRPRRRRTCARAPSRYGVYEFCRPAADNQFSSRSECDARTASSADCVQFRVLLLSLIFAFCLHSRAPITTRPGFASTSVVITPSVTVGRSSYSKKPLYREYKSYTMSVFALNDSGISPRDNLLVFNEHRVLSEVQTLFLPKWMWPIMIIITS